MTNSKRLKFENAQDAQEACDLMNAGKRTKHTAYRVEGEGFEPFFTVGRNSSEARGNAATVLNVRVTVAETIGLLERLVSLPSEELEKLRELLTRNNLGAFLEHEGEA